MRYTLTGLMARWAGESDAPKGRSCFLSAEQHSLVLPPDFRRYFAEVNGFANGSLEMDSLLISLVPRRGCSSAGIMDTRRRDCR